MTQKTCADCGTGMELSTTECPECGAVQPDSRPRRSKSWLIVLLMCVFGGALGFHRFYVGKIGSGTLMLLSLGGLGVWVLHDLVKISMSLFTDKRGNLIIHA
jgi:TM2 domain-containing membrane protein YozV